MTKTMAKHNHAIYIFFNKLEIFFAQNHYICTKHNFLLPVQNLLMNNFSKTYAKFPFLGRKLFTTPPTTGTSEFLNILFRVSFDMKSTFAKNKMALISDLKSRSGIFLISNPVALGISKVAAARPE